MMTLTCRIILGYLRNIWVNAANSRVHESRETSADEEVKRLIDTVPLAAYAHLVVSTSLLFTPIGRQKILIEFGFILDTYKIYI